MERVNYDYSMKNIPIPSDQAYMKTFIAKLEAFIGRVRWKAFFFDQSNDNDNSHSANFSFSTVNTPPQNEHLKYFETGLECTILFRF